MKVQSKKIIVTGGGNGMGRELVFNLLSKGATVLAVDINQTALKETLSLCLEDADRISIYQLDITDRKAVEDFINLAISDHGHIDGIINNAGIIQPFVNVSELDYQVIDRVFNVNIFGTINTIKSLIPHFHNRPEAHIVNISSMGGFLPVPGQTIYGASKAAVKLLTEGLHSELADTNIKVSIVFPGSVHTNISSNSGVNIPMTAGSEDNAKRKILTANRAAEIIVSGIESDKFRIMVGKDAKMMDLLYRLNPIYAAKFIAVKIKKLMNN